MNVLSLRPTVLQLQAKTQTVKRSSAQVRLREHVQAKTNNDCIPSRHAYQTTLVETCSWTIESRRRAAEHRGQQVLNNEARLVFGGHEGQRLFVMPHLQGVKRYTGQW